MPDLSLAPLPRRPELRRALSRLLERQSPPLRVLAEGVAGESSIIDLLAADHEGGLVVVVVADEGEDAAGFTRALAHRIWAKTRVADWLKFAPELGLRSQPEVRAVLLCPAITRETLNANRAAGGHGIELGTLRCVQLGGGAGRRLGAASSQEASPSWELLLDWHAEARDHGGELASQPGAPASSSFRSGLTEEELNLSAAEIRELAP